MRMRFIGPHSFVTRAAKMEIGEIYQVLECDKEYRVKGFYFVSKDKFEVVD